MLDPQTLVRELARALPRQWGARADEIAVHGAGMNSVTASVTLSTGRYVAKWVPAEYEDALRRGASTARLMAAGGLDSGEPLPTLRGEVVGQLAGGAVSLLREVRGVALTGETEADQVAIGRTLARAHAIGGTRTRGEFFGWLRADAPHLDVEPWIRPLVGAVGRELDDHRLLTWGVVHTDPAPDAFVRDPAGDVGLIDWTGASDGPLLYDVASAVMYLGGHGRARIFLEEYRASGGLDSREIESGLDVLFRFRAAVQAAYFARRITEGDLTGIDSPEDNLHGLEDAARMLLTPGEGG